MYMHMPIVVTRIAVVERAYIGAARTD